MKSLDLELKSKFLDEAEHLLVDAEQCFLSLESRPGDTALMDKIFRLAHNLKGGAKAVGFAEIGAFSHLFESFIQKIKKGEIAKTAEVIGILLKCSDFLTKSIRTLRGDLDAKIDIAGISAEVEAFVKKILGAAATAQPEAPAMSMDDLDKMIQAEIDKHAEMKRQEIKLESKPANKTANKAEETFEGPRAEDVAALLRAEAQAPAAPQSHDFGPLREKPRKVASSALIRDESIRVSLNRLDRLLDFVGEMVILQTMLREQVPTSRSDQLSKTVNQIGKVTKEVQDITLSLRMVPVKQTFQKVQRIVRDTSILLGKKVTLHLEGEDTEIDKTVLEYVNDPLVHLVNNALDHGIESAEQREKAGKGIDGNIWLKAFHQGGKLLVEVRDDGAGIDPEAIRRKAVQKGLIKNDEQISENDLIQLIFQPGFSTKSDVTEISGRGVGMDVVKMNLEALQGDVVIETELGKGTCFKVMLPLTLAIIEGMVVRSGPERYVIPLSQVYESVSPKRGEVQFNSGLNETLTLRDECIPLVRLDHTLGRKSRKAAWDSIAIVVRSTGHPFALLVDDILGQQQIVIKKLGSELQRLRAFSGTAVLGDGKPALIIEASEIAAMARPISRQDMENWEKASA